MANTVKKNRDANTSSKTSEVRLRPSERVIEYLNVEFLGSDKMIGCRVPTTKELARKLGVAVSTVQKVFKMLVSDGVLDAAPGRGTFVAKKRESATIIVNFGGIEDVASGLWQSRIGGAIMHAAAAMKTPPTILPLTSRDLSRSLSETHWQDAMDRASGIIVFPHPSISEIAELARKKNLPCVTLHPLGIDKTADFVSPDYAEACRFMGDVAIKAGRRRIALVQAHPAGISASNFLRAAGLLDAIGNRLGDQVSLKIIDAQSASLSTGRDAAAALFAKGAFHPDCVFCRGDFLAHGFLDWLSENGISCPGQVSVVAGTGLHHAPDPWPGMTTIEQPLCNLGQTLLAFLLRRIDAGVPLPGIYLPCTFRGGATTLPAENKLFSL
jgi:DNA-binding LacI/PurR family transcriptional regulator